MMTKLFYSIISDIRYVYIFINRHVMTAMKIFPKKRIFYINRS